MGFPFYIFKKEEKRMGHCIKCRTDFEGDGFICNRCKFYLDLESSVIDQFADMHPQLSEYANDDKKELRNIQRQVAYDMLNASMELYQPILIDRVNILRGVSNSVKNIADRRFLSMYISSFDHISRQIYYTCGHPFGGNCV